jgi:glutaredoxin 3
MMHKVAVKVIMYVKPLCPYCINAKKLLEQKLLDHTSIQYEEININKNPELFNTVKSTYNVNTVPQIFIIYEDGSKTHVQGYSALTHLDKAEKLDDMLYTTTHQNDNHNKNNDDFCHNSSTEHKSSNDNHEYDIKNNSDVDVSYNSEAEIVFN